MIYDAQFAHFMETLTAKEPGRWYPNLLKACEYYNINPNDVYEAITDMRLQQYSSPENEALESDSLEIRAGQYSIRKCGEDSIWISNKDGEGMELSQATLDDIWEKYF
jgi:hypothetical protein